jgi:Uma2 family endonuclease
MTTAPTVDPDLPPSWWEPPRRCTEAAYWAYVIRTEEPFEFDSGWMYHRQHPPESHWRMRGGTLAHASMVVGLLSRIGTHLEHDPCQVLNSQILLAVAPGRLFTADVVVCCAQGLCDADRSLPSARLIIEVLTESTEHADRGRKYRAYQRMADMAEYVLVDSRRRQVEVYRPGTTAWYRAQVATADTVRLASIDYTLDLDALYARIHDLRGSEHGPADIDAGRFHLADDLFGDWAAKGHWSADWRAWDDDERRRINEALRAISEEDAHEAAP